MESGGGGTLRRILQRRVHNRDRHADGGGAGQPHVLQMNDENEKK